MINYILAKAIGGDAFPHKKQAIGVFDKTSLTERPDSIPMSVIHEAYLSLPSQPFVVVGDLTKSEDVRRVIDNTVEHFGRLDVLVSGQNPEYEVTA